VVNHLKNREVIKKARIHPVHVLTAWFTYRKGHGKLSKHTWVSNREIIKALEEMFYLSFKNIEPTGKRICFLIDCSGSMCSPSLCEGVTCAESAALLAMIFARSETTKETSPDHSFYLFTSKSGGGCVYTSKTGLTDVSDVIDAKAEFVNVVAACQRSDWGSTDISMGILEALKYKRKYDAFVVITDNDVNSGIKPSEAMKQYRTGMKMPTTKLVVVATQGSDYTIADPSDPFMMDMVGFDAHGPKILQDFIRM
jgi:60 kDa SS-A/Ro ribonucleoprotein